MLQPKPYKVIRSYRIAVADRQRGRKLYAERAGVPQYGSIPVRFGIEKTPMGEFTMAEAAAIRRRLRSFWKVVKLENAT
jgi:hypothetical protein